MGGVMGHFYSMRNEKLCWEQHTVGNNIHIVYFVYKSSSNLHYISPAAFINFSIHDCSLISTLLLHKHPLDQFPSMFFALYPHPVTNSEFVCCLVFKFLVCSHSDTLDF